MKTRKIMYGVSEILHTGTDEAFERMQRHIKQTTQIKANKQEAAPMQKIGKKHVRYSFSKEELQLAWEIYETIYANGGHELDLLRALMEQFGIGADKARHLRRSARQAQPKRPKGRQF